VIGVRSTASAEKFPGEGTNGKEDRKIALLSLFQGEGATTEKKTKIAKKY